MPIDVVVDNAATAPGPIPEPYGFNSWEAFEEGGVEIGGRYGTATCAAFGSCPVPDTVANTDDGWETSGADEAS